MNEINKTNELNHGEATNADTLFSKAFSVDQSASQ